MLLDVQSSCCIPEKGHKKKCSKPRKPENSYSPKSSVQMIKNGWGAGVTILKSGLVNYTWSSFLVKKVILQRHLATGYVTTIV